MGALRLLAGASWVLLGSLLGALGALWVLLGCSGVAFREHKPKTMSMSLLCQTQAALSVFSCSGFSVKGGQDRSKIDQNVDHFFDRFLVSFWAPLGALLGVHLGPLGCPSWPKFGPRGLSEHDFSKKVIFQEFERHSRESTL